MVQLTLIRYSGNNKNKQMQKMRFSIFGTAILHRRAVLQLNEEKENGPAHGVVYTCLLPLKTIKMNLAGASTFFSHPSFWQLQTDNKHIK